MVGLARPRPGSGAGTAAGGVRRSMGHTTKRTAPAAARATPTARYSSGRSAGAACRNCTTKNCMNAKIPSAWPRGPQRRA
ncbi:hypothetical protein K701_01125 [Streptomyces fradiae ATCC 10745 = DSM 40063]|uniref:Uncharacterized protein n=1 Tax=Streptomyces fradiae ATCC 10745 = DSM 40063 TaxID=1319510 RepID=A0ABQ6Y196_STRFR|nr:hypothetical protein K701_01125 [Streptomyces fradiae ATCC 10745 = DSM 40063]